MNKLILMIHIFFRGKKKAHLSMPFAYSNKNAKKACLRRASLNELCFSQTERLDFGTSKFKVLLTTLIHKLFLM